MAGKNSSIVLGFPTVKFIAVFVNSSIRIIILI